MDPKKNSLFRKLTLISIGVTLVLLLCLPFCVYWDPGETEESQGAWSYGYLIGDDLLLPGLLPFYLFFPLSLLSKSQMLKLILKIVLFILAGLYFAYGFLTLQVPLQDYSPHLGTYLLMTLLPQLVYLHYMDMWVKYNAKNPKDEAGANVDAEK